MQLTGASDILRCGNLVALVVWAPIWSSRGWHFSYGSAACYVCVARVPQTQWIPPGYPQLGLRIPVWNQGPLLLEGRELQSCDFCLVLAATGAIHRVFPLLPIKSPYWMV